jgi:Uma2 family endonuclease
MECKLLIPEWKSERHPDLAVYLKKPKGPKDRTLWRRWLPELAIEVVSERSVDRDYIDKRQEYWDLGIKEYWIVDAKREKVVILRRGKSDWIEKRVGPDGVVTTKLLPGFELPFKAIMEAAAQAGMDEE